MASTVTELNKEQSSSDEKIIDSIDVSLKLMSALCKISRAGNLFTDNEQVLKNMEDTIEVTKELLPGATRKQLQFLLRALRYEEIILGYSVKAKTEDEFGTAEISREVIVKSQMKLSSKLIADLSTCIEEIQRLINDKKFPRESGYTFMKEMTLTMSKLTAAIGDSNYDTKLVESLIIEAEDISARVVIEVAELKEAMMKPKIKGLMKW